MSSYDPTFPDIATRMLPKTPKMTPKSDPKTRKFDFQKHVFYYSKTILLEVMTPSILAKETSQGKFISFLTTQMQKSEPTGSKAPPNELLQATQNSPNFILKWTQAPKGQPLEPVAAPRLLKWPQNSSDDPLSLRLPIKFDCRWSLPRLKIDEHSYDVAQGITPALGS